MTEPKIPTCEKWAAAGPRWRPVQEFIEFLNAEGVCLTPDIENQYPRILGETDQLNLIYKWLDIDPEKLEKERRALLDYQRQLNEARR